MILAGFAMIWIRRTGEVDRVELWDQHWTAANVRLPAVKWTVWLLIAIAIGGTRKIAVIAVDGPAFRRSRALFARAGS